MKQLDLSRLAVTTILIFWISFWNLDISHSNLRVPSQHTEEERQDIPCDELLPAWIWNLSPDFERQLYSQYGEDGITDYLLGRLPGKANPYYVEFGVENGTECNTRILREHYGWEGLMMDGFHQNTSIGLHQHLIHPKTIVSLFETYNVPKDLGVFSEDTDYADFYLWQQILEAGYQPRILISEVNSNFLPNEAATVLPPPDDNLEEITTGSGNYYGVSPLALRHLWNRHGYLMVYCTQQQVNCFGVRAEDVLQAKHINLLSQAQQCLWEKPIAWFYQRHPCEADPAKVYRKVDRFGQVTDEVYEPWFLEGCKNELGPWKKRAIQFNIMS